MKELNICEGRRQAGSQGRARVRMPARRKFGPRRDRKPVDLVLEEVVVEVPVEAAMEGSRRRLPLHRIREVQLSPRRERHRVLGSQIHLDDASIVEADRELLVLSLIHI